MALNKEKGVNFLSNCEGYHQLLKGLHWQTDNKAEHLLSDEIDEAVLEFEDKMAENIMGVLDEKIHTGELKTMLPEATDIKGLLSEMEKDIFDFMDYLHDEKPIYGILNILDDFLESINKWKYLATLK